MRAVSAQLSNEPLSVGILEVHPTAYRASLRGEALELTPSQHEMLTALVANRQRVLSRAELARAASLEQQRSVDVILSSLRRVLGDGFVRNIRNRGWILDPSAFEG
jgi:DNA-binding response OmpR family regulator